MLKAGDVIQYTYNYHSKIGKILRVTCQGYEVNELKNANKLMWPTVIVEFHRAKVKAL